MPLLQCSERRRVFVGRTVLERADGDGWTRPSDGAAMPAAYGFFTGGVDERTMLASLCRRPQSITLVDLSPSAVLLSSRTRLSDENAFQDVTERDVGHGTQAYTGLVVSGKV